MNNSRKMIETAMNRALRYLSFQPRTVRQTRDYLIKNNVDEETVSQVIKELVDARYLDDKNFAELFIGSRVRHKPKSKFAFRYELRQKGIDESIIEKVLETLDDHLLALQSVKPKLKLWKRLDENEFRKKLMIFLRYRGFSYETCMHVVQTVKN